MYSTPQGIDQNKQPIPFATLLGTDHRAGLIAQLENPAGEVLAWAFGVSGGSITVDRGAKFRRQATLEVMPYGGAGIVGDSSLTPDQETALKASLMPSRAGDPTSPYGNLFRIYYGIQVPGYVNGFLGGDTYYWHQGLFRISEARISDDETPKLTITGYDHSRTISRNRFTKPWVVAAGQNYGDAIIALAADRLGATGITLESNPHTVTATTPAIVLDPEQDPWDAIQDWGQAIGCDVYFDASARLTITPVPDPTVQPVTWVYADGGQVQNATLLSVDRAMTDEPGYNGVVLTSESTTIAQPLRSEVWDLNPESPTYALGGYGRVPKFVSSPYVTTQAQCDAAAAAELQKSVGGTETLSLAVVPNPAHEAGDVIRVLRPLSKTDQVTTIESFELPFGTGDQMRITCQETRSITA